MCVRVLLRTCIDYPRSKLPNSRLIVTMHCVTQLKLDTVEKLSSSIFCCLSVRHWCHPTKSPLFPIYTGIQALWWPNTIYKGIKALFWVTHSILGLVTFTFLSVLNFQFHFPWLGQYSGWKTFSACASSERTWGPKYSVGLTLEKLIFWFCFELIWFLSCWYLTYIFKIFKLQIHPKGDQSLPHCCHPFHCEWKTVILSQQSSKSSPPSQSKS